MHACYSERANGFSVAEDQKKHMVVPSNMNKYEYLARDVVNKFVASLARFAGRCSIWTYLHYSQSKTM